MKTTPPAQEEQDALWEASSNLGLVEEVDPPNHLKTIEKKESQLLWITLDLL